MKPSLSSSHLYVRKSKLLKSGYHFNLITLLICGIVVLIPWYARVLSAGNQCTAFLNLETHIDIHAQTQSITVDFSGTGDFEVTTNFIVEANTPMVEMFVEATDFHFTGANSGPFVSPIPLDESAGVAIEPQDAMPVGGDENANYIGDGDPIEGYPSRKTETIVFESSDGSFFSNPVSVTVTWNQDDPMKTAGQYMAKIKLTCLAPPP